MKLITQSRLTLGSLQHGAPNFSTKNAQHAANMGDGGEGGEKQGGK